MKIQIFICFLFLAVLTACKSDYSQDALGKAREFTLENTKTLPELSRDYVRYTIPEVQISMLHPYHGRNLTEYAHLPRHTEYKPISDPQRDFLYINFVWSPPDLEYSIITVGTGLRNYRFWEPLKVILKKPEPYRYDYENLRTKAIGYAMNNMLYLSTAEKNRIRFSEVSIYPTNFQLDFLSEQKDYKGGPDSWKNYISSLKKKSSKKQYSAVWKADKASKKIVVTGYSTGNSLHDWLPSAGMTVETDKLKKFVSGPEYYTKENLK